MTLSNPVGFALDGAVIAIAQARGGIGATTLAVNLTSKLRGEKKAFGKTNFKSVALLDLDLQFGNANVFLDLEDNGALQKMIEDNVIPDDQYVRGMMQTHASGIDILNAPSEIIPLTSVNPQAISALIEALRRNYDYVVIDLPRAIVDWLEPVIAKTTLLQIVMDTSIPSIRHAKRLIDFYRDIQAGLPVELIVNHETKPWPKSARCKEAEQILEMEFSHWLPDDPVPARKAADLGVPISTNYASAALSKSIAKLAKKVISSNVIDEIKSTSNKGVF
ncbi:MAG: AAA family ATPase [Paracoccaceae bacterium]